MLSELGYQLKGKMTTIPVTSDACLIQKGFHMLPHVFQAMPLSEVPCADSTRVVGSWCWWLCLQWDCLAIVMDGLILLIGNKCAIWLV